MSADPALARALLSQLRDELVGLTNDVRPFGDLPSPTRRIEPGERYDKSTGVIWEVPSYAELGVLPMDDEPGVFVQGHPLSLSPDWHAISSKTARALALALLAAADRSDRKHPPLEST